jgi:accessory gene regulator B
MALRTYSGGYHASTPIRCYILTTMSITVSLSIMKFVAINNFIYLGLSILSSLVILLISPIGTPNKPLDEIEINIYRKKTIIVWCVEISVALMSFVLNVTEIHTSIVFAQVLISIALVFGKVQYH